MLRELFKIHEEQFLPIFKNYEVYRKREYIKYIIFVSFISCFVVALTAVCTIEIYLALNNKPSLFSTDNPLPFMLAGIIIPFVVICVPAFYEKHIKEKNKQFQITLKKNCLGKVLALFGNIKWINKFQEGEKAKSLIPDDDLEKSALFPFFEKRNIDDEFYGTWNGVDYKISETQLISEYTHKGQKQQTILFKGIVIKFRCNKKIKNRTIVSTKGDLTKKNSVMVMICMPALASLAEVFRNGFSWFKFIFWLIIFGGLGCVFAKLMKETEEPLEEVILEDPIFGKRFHVYSSDQIEARYLVTPSFMERLYNLKTTFGAKNIKCSFYKDSLNDSDCLMIAINTKKDLFELGDLYHSLLNTNSHIQLCQDLKSIMDLVDYFKLDKKTGL